MAQEPVFRVPDAHDHEPGEPAQEPHGAGRQTILAHHDRDDMHAHRDDEHDRCEEPEPERQRFGVQGDEGRTGTPSPEPDHDGDHDRVEQELDGRTVDGPSPTG